MKEIEKIDTEIIETPYADITMNQLVNYLWDISNKINEIVEWIDSKKDQLL